jgi:hypothetical protein
VLKVVCGEISIPNKIGMFIGTKAHILINLGIYSPLSSIADDLIFCAL